MPRLTRSSIRSRLVRDDRGAVALMVGILLSTGVLLGMGALAVDVGRLYAEREELQSGADAGASKVALNCAFNRLSCSAAGALTASGGYANRNAKDGASGVAQACGYDGKGRLPSCAGDSAGALAQCIGSAPSGRYVEVRTRTRTSDGGTLLPPTFARMLVPGDTGTMVGACARVTWGPPTIAGGLAITFSACEWGLATGGGTSYPSEPVTAAAEVILKTHTTTGVAGCPAGPSGFDAPGGFGVLDGAKSGCVAGISTGGIYNSDPGASVGDCEALLASAWASRQPLGIPIYDTVRRCTGSTPGCTSGYAQYHLKTMAAFVVTGYQFPSAKQKSWLTGKSCATKGSDNCISGYFVNAAISGDIDPSAEIAGAVAVRTVG